MFPDGSVLDKYTSPSSCDVPITFISSYVNGWGNYFSGFFNITYVGLNVFVRVGKFFCLTFFLDLGRGFLQRDRTTRTVSDSVPFLQQ